VPGKLPYIWGSPLVFLQQPHCPLSVSGASCIAQYCTIHVVLHELCYTKTFITHQSAQNSFSNNSCLEYIFCWVQVSVKVRPQWKQLTVVRGSSLSVVAKLLYWSAVLYNLHVGTSRFVEIDGELLTDDQPSQSIDSHHIRCLYFLVLQCLLQVWNPHFY